MEKKNYFKLMLQNYQPVLVFAENYEILKTKAKEKFRGTEISLFYDSHNDLEITNQEEFDDLLHHSATLEEIGLVVNYSSRLSGDEKKFILSNSKKVDFCIMMNSSKTNKKYIDSLPNNLKEKIEEMKKHYSDLEIRVGFIVYCDDDEDAVFFDFRNYDDPELENFLKNIEIDEKKKHTNFMSGMKYINNMLSWAQGRQTRVLFHLCDSPYSFKEGEHHVLNYFKVNKINYCFCKINQETSTMIADFNEIFIDILCLRKLTVYECRDKDSFLYSIQRSIFETILLVEKISIKKPDDDDDDDDLSKINISIQQDFNKNEFLEHEGTLEVISIDDGNFRKFIEKKGNIEKYITIKLTKIKISLSKKPFDKGHVRQVYLAYLHSERGDLKCVAKKSLCRRKKYRTKKYFVNMLCTQVVSQFLAKIYESNNFNYADKPILYLNVALLKINNEYYTVEKYIEPNDFIKWSHSLQFLKTNNYNNNDFLFFSTTLDAFSHWTYSQFNEFLLVTDLQGIEYENKEKEQKEFVLTDPVIHCSREQFDRTDFSDIGIENFFKKHLCNVFCEKLRLKKHTLQPKGESKGLTLPRAVGRKPLFEDYNYELLF